MRDDIVRIIHRGEQIGEATVMSVQVGKATISLKGVYEVSPGDTVEFARKPKSAVRVPEAKTSKTATTDSPESNAISAEGIHEGCGGKMTSGAKGIQSCNKCSFTAEKPESLQRIRIPRVPRIPGF